MTVDVASLVFEIDSRQAETAQQRFEKLIVVSDRLDASARKVKTATEMAGIGMNNSATGTRAAAKAATELATSEGAVERATRGAAAASASTRAARALEAAAMRELVAATKAYARDQTAADKAVERSAQQVLAFRQRMARQQATEAAEGAREASAAQIAADRADERSAGQVLAFRQRMARQQAAEAAQSAQQALADQVAADRAAERSAQEVFAFRVRMARQRATEESQEAKAALAEQVAADRAAEASAQQVFAFRVRMARQRANEEAAEAKRSAQMAADAARDQAAAVASLEARIHSLKSSIDPAYAAQSRLDAEMREATALYKMGAISATDYARAMATLGERQSMVSGAMMGGAQSFRVAQRAGIDLSRQFADVGVQAAMMTNPLMILIMQGPQIADTLGVMRANGVGVGAAFRQIGVFLGPVLAGLAPLIIGVGAVAAGFGLLHRELSKGYPDDITKGMGLTEEQLDRVKDKTVTFGDTMMATFTVVGRHIMEGPIGDALDWWGEQWNILLDQLTSSAFDATTSVMAFFSASYKTIVDNWSDLPSALGVIMANAVNAMNRSLEWFINGNIRLVNKFQAAWSEITGGKAKLQLPEMKLPTYDPAKFGGADIAADFAADYAKDKAAFQAGGKALLAEIRAAAITRAQDRAREEAGKPNKGSAAGGPRDMTDERSAQIDAMLAEAKADELQARLSLTKDVQKRADLEKQILTQEVAKEQAQIARRMADVADDKGLTAAKKAELTEQLWLLSLVTDMAASHRERLIEEEKIAALSREKLDREVADRDLQIDVLDSQAAASKSATERRMIGEDILKLEQQIERLKLEEVTAANGATETEVEIAKARLAVLEQIHANQRMSEEDKLQAAFEELSDATGDIASAFRSKNWNALVNSLQSAFQSLKAAFSSAGTAADKIGAVSGVASMAGSAIGGGIGAGLSGAASGAMAGFTLGGPVGAAIGGVIGGIAGIFGHSKQKKAEKAAREQAAAEDAARKAIELANAKRRIEITLMELQGDAAGALAARRLDELAAMDASLRPMAEQIYAIQDKAEAEAKAAEVAAAAKAVADERREIDIAYMEAVGNAAGAEAARREDYLASLNAVNRAAQEAVYAALDLAAAQEAATRAQEEATRALDAARDAARSEAQSALKDAQQAADQARGALTEAYNREAGAIEQTRDKFNSFAESLAAFRRQLFTGQDAMRDPASQYSATSAAFRRVTDLPAGSEERVSTIQGLAEDFLAASLARAPSAAAYNRDLMEVRRAIADSEKAARNEVDVATRQLNALNASVAGLLTVNDSVLSVRDAIVGLQAALSALGKAQGAADAFDPAKPATTSFADYVRGNADVLAAYNAYGAARGQSMADFGKQHWASTGFQEGRSVIPGFATGGAFTVGGSGGTDSQHVQFMATPGEDVTIRTPGQQGETAELVAEVRALRAELARIAKSTDQTQSELKNMQGNGLFVRGRSPEDPVQTDEAA